METVTNSYEIMQFYGWWEFVTCLFAFACLIGIWYHIGKKQNDFGQVWLALSILSWSLSGLVEIYYANQGLSTANQATMADGWRSVFSLCNSLFILLALPWFRYLPKVLASTIQSKHWYLIVGLPFLFCLLPTLSRFFKLSGPMLVSELDVYYSVLTLIVLGLVLWSSFTRRGLVSLAYLSVCCILITFVAQVYKMTGSSVDQLLLSAIFKTSLIMIFFALALSWVRELSEQLRPDEATIFLSITKDKSNAGNKPTISLSGISNETSEFSLGTAQNLLLEKFVRKRISDKDGWLEIMPKGDERSGRQYDIKDYNEVKRLIVRMLDETYGKNNWDKAKHEIPFKEALFERSELRDRKIRLKIGPDQLKLD